MIWELNGTTSLIKAGERCVLFAGQGAVHRTNFELNQPIMRQLLDSKQRSVGLFRLAKSCVR